MKPLTLEELKQMDGKPVWGKSLINDKPGEWFIVRIVQTSKVWLIACAGAEQGFGDKDTYGKTWLAYSEEPTHIDREAWEPCGLCEKQRKVFNENFCGECGRPLTDEAWDELERRLLKPAKED